MKPHGLAAALAALGMLVIFSGDALAACPKGQITCQQWCKRNKPNRPDIQQGCVHTDPHSCANNYGGNINHCVPADGKERFSSRVIGY
ncbi:MAG: hypothetical protein JO019_03920 [Candidatus Kaiserbacteria bacterium]|nr:hypothetical protein [Candidatus Kaiserbacteria bacterium]